MPSTFFGLSIASSGIYTYQARLNVTGHNVSNARTDGYTRQTAVQKTKNPISLGTSYGMIGAGSEVTEIVNSRDSYYDYKYRKSNTNYGYYDTLTYYMESIQDHLYSADATSAGLSNSIGNFFNTLVSMNGDAANTTKRTEAMGYADTFAKYANEMVRNLKEMQHELNTEISTTVNKINAYAEEIASLNKQINSLEVYGGKANDLRDQRARLIDELSTLANVDVVEQAPPDGVNGLTQYIVTVGGGVLVDTYSVNKLQVVPMQTYANQNDATGLYDIRWSNGQSFGIRNKNLGGTLQGLLEIRDGNNAENFKADLDVSSVTAGGRTIKMSAGASSVEAASNLAKLNIPSTKGVITVGGVELEYESFEVKIDSNGEYSYEFTLKEAVTASDKARIDKFAADAGGDLKAQIGDSVEFRGIPYYISQLNELVRTFSATLNQQQNRGYDLYDNKGVDMFMATDITSNEQLDMTEFLKNTSDGYYYLNGNKVFAQGTATNTDYTDYLAKKGYNNAADYTITDNGAQTIAGLSYNMMTVTDKDGKVVENIYRANQAEIFKFSSITTAGQSTSYYSLTAETFGANKEMVKDGKLIAAALKDIDGSNTGTSETGIDENGNLEILAALKSDTTMFKQGDPIAFLQVMTATAGVDGDKVASSADNAKDITEAVDLRRLSVSGVDEDEEGQMMIELQNLLNAQYRVVSIMNQVLNKLINEMGA